MTLLVAVIGTVWAVWAILRTPSTTDQLERGEGGVTHLAGPTRCENRPRLTRVL